MNICFVTDPLLVTVGAVKPALLLAREVRKLGHNVTLISPSVGIKVKEFTKKFDIQLKDLGMKQNLISPLPTFEAWIRFLFRRKSSLSLDQDSVLINTSSCMKIESEAYYAQGPMTKALDDMLSEMSTLHKYGYYSLSLVLRFLEEKSIKELRWLSKVFISNSNFCALMYKKYGIRVDDVIYPPLDCEFFKPTTSKPSANYVLTYIGPYGKETKFSVLRVIADAGVKLRAFGYKALYIPRHVLRHPNIEWLGEVSDHKLVNLYSNAAYTLFTFNHEPFGYVPVESMACGTPVVTYNAQGPKESVVKGTTGWLANSDHEIIRLALELWNTGYPKSMRTECIKRASEFDAKKTAKKWINVLKRLKNQNELR